MGALVGYDFATGLELVPGLVPRNDKEAGANRDSVLKKRNDKVGHFERSHKAGTPLMAGESSRNTTSRTKDGTGRGRLSCRYANASPGKSTCDKAGDQSHGRGAAGRRGQLIRNDLYDRKHSEDGDSGG